jgi:hypothetical protein
MALVVGRHSPEETSLIWHAQNDRNPCFVVIVQTAPGPCRQTGFQGGKKLKSAVKSGMNSVDKHHRDSQTK